MTGFLGLVLSASLAQAEEPTISCKMDGENFIVTYTGELYQSTDAISWSKVDSASSPYQVKVGNKKLFFCTKGEAVDRNLIIPLSDTVNLDMIWIKPGTFIMGSPEDELGRLANETQHQVTLTQGYWLGKFEVTQSQYEAVTGVNPSKFKGADLPVEMVNWNEAKEFCTKLTAIEKAAGRLPEGYEYNLPTEAQWEYACRAGTTTALNSGKNLSDKEQCPEMDEVGWYVGNSKYNGNKTTHPVGQKLPNAWGLYDMHGNVWEWCLDWYADYPTTAVTDPMGPDTGIYRVNRGASMAREAYKCRSARRNGPLDGRYVDAGFRVALTPIRVSKDVTIPLSEDVNLDMIWIKPGTFIMGSPEDEIGRGLYYSETQHQVTLTQGYWMGKFEVTQAQYEAVMGTNPSGSKGADLPVVRVNWSDSMEFCAKLTAIEREAGRLPEGYEYTLPTEAQWEYACRAGTTTAFNNGTNIPTEEQIGYYYDDNGNWHKGEPCPNLDEVGWYAYNSGDYDSNGNYTGNAKTSPVGQKQPNAWGLYDMHGNVWEWCLDWYRSYPTAAVTDPKGPVTGSYRVNRGGSIARYADSCRSATRNGPPDGWYMDAGFRVALAPIRVSKDKTIPLSEDVNLDMIWIEPGTFMMGSPEDELGRRDDEVQHQVTLTKGYWLGKYEVTQAQYEAVMGTNPSWYKGDDLPVECVSWFDAKEFCSKLTALEREAGRLPEGYRYTLPTEAQWEYACRAGTTTALNSGNNLSKTDKSSEMNQVGWYWYNAGVESYEKGLTCTRPVGQKMANAWGLYDMHGNVAEWCSDFYEDYPASAVVDPTGADTGIDRVVRWGSWWHYAWVCRSACRGYDASDAKYTNLGFRVALAPVKE